jgi:hypothetical protein
MMWASRCKLVKISLVPIFTALVSEADGRLGMAGLVPQVDLTGWRDGGPARRAAIATAADDACRRVGFLEIVGHGIDPAVLERALAALDGFWAKSTAAIASLFGLAILSDPVGGGSWDGSAHRGGVAWTPKWNPAPRRAPFGRCGWRVGLVPNAFPSWFRLAARGNCRSA